MADEFKHRHEQKIGPKCFLDIAVSKYTAGVAADIVLRYSKSIFGQYNCTKNRGACVDGLIGLASETSQIILAMFKLIDL